MDVRLLLGTHGAGRDNLDGARLLGRQVGIEDLLGNRATNGQGGNGLLGHGSTERDRDHSGAGPTWFTPKARDTPKFISRTSGRTGSTKQWSQQNLDITSLLNDNKQVGGPSVSGFSMVDAKPEWELGEAYHPEGDIQIHSSSEEKDYADGTNAASSNPLKRKARRELGRGSDKGEAIAKRKGARAKTMPGRSTRKKGTSVAERAMECAKDAQWLGQETKELEDKYFSATSKQGKDSRATTVLRIASELMGGYPFPLVKMTVVRVSACIRATRIQSGDQYLGELRTMHVEAGYPVGELLDRTFKLCQRALRRDRGPENRAPEYRMELIQEQTIWENLQGRKAVLWPVLAYYWAVVWMLREIELREVKIKDVKITMEQKRVTLTIRKSKMDQAARGVRRTLACICGTDGCGMDCPWSLAVVVLGRRDKGSREDYLFGTVEGIKATKDAMTKAWQVLLNEEIKGHTPRRTGAMHYVRQGMAIQDLAYLGRWKSQAVLRYAEEALEDQPVNETFVQREEIKRMLSKNRKGIVVVEESPNKKDIEQAEPAPQTPAAPPDTPGQEGPPQALNPLVKKQSIVLFVRSTGRGGQRPLHKVAVANWKLPTSSWATACGWKFASKSNRFAFVTGEEKGKSFCSKCKDAAEKRDDVREVEMWRTELPMVGAKMQPTAPAEDERSNQNGGRAGLLCEREPVV